MRRAVWIAAVVAVLVAAWVLVPSLVVQRQVASALGAYVEATGSLRVVARTTVSAFIRGQIVRLDLDASSIRLGDVTAERLSARLRGVSFRRGEGGRLTLTGVEEGTVDVHVHQRDLEAYLGSRRVERPSVTIDPSGITAGGELRMGPLTAAVRLRGQFYVVSGTDLYFQVASLDLSGVDVPPALVVAALGMAQQPVLSLRTLPVAVAVTQIAYHDGRMTVSARAGRTP